MNKEVFEDYYKLLGVTKNVTPEELRKVRRELSKKYHPDLVQDEQEKEERHKKLSRINNAIGVLSNPSQKYEYDLMYEEYYRQTGKSTKEIFDFDKHEQTSTDAKEQVWYAADFNNEPSDYEETWYDYGFKGKNNQQEQANEEPEPTMAEDYEEQETVENEYEESINYENKKTERRHATTGRFEQKTPKKQQKVSGKYVKAGKYAKTTSTMFEDIKQAIREVREEEQQSKKTIECTHKEVNNYVNKTFRGYRNTYPGEIAYRFTKGTLHIFVSTIYELSKLKYVTKDSIPKFVIRNRYAATTLAALIIASGLTNVNTSNQEVPVVTPSITIEQPTEEKNVVEENIVYDEELTAMLQEQQKPETLTIKRIHTIEYGDTLTDIAADAGCTITEIKNANNLFSTDLILAGTKISIPYTYSAEDIDYFTDEVNFETGTTIKDVANQYNTDSATIIALNDGAIYENKGTYYIISDTLRVPNFATQYEVEQQKTASLSYTK